MSSKAHWEQVCATRPSQMVSWFQERAHRSLAFIQSTGLPRSARIIDVGGGASTLVDDLCWLEANLLETGLPAQTHAVWHDQAVFHFLTAASDRQRHVQKVYEALKPSGYLMAAVFAEDGPSQCSGLPVMRYRPGDLEAELGSSLVLIDQQPERHLTPAGQEQSFVYCFFRRKVAI